MNDTVTSVEKHDTENLVDQVEVGKLLVNGSGDRYEVEWDVEAKVTPMGSLVFFAPYLQTGGLMDRSLFEPPGSKCGAVEHRGGLGHHPVGRFRQMAAREGP